MGQVEFIRSAAELLAQIGQRQPGIGQVFSSNQRAADYGHVPERGVRF
jgi:hypothetical protein